MLEAFCSACSEEYTLAHHFPASISCPERDVQHHLILHVSSFAFRRVSFGLSPGVEITTLSSACCQWRWFTNASEMMRFSKLIDFVSQDRQEVEKR